VAVVFVCGSHTLLPLGRRDTAGDTSWELFMFLPGRVSLRPSEYVRWGGERERQRAARWVWLYFVSGSGCILSSASLTSVGRTVPPEILCPHSSLVGLFGSEWDFAFIVFPGGMPGRPWVCRKSPPPSLIHSLSLSLARGSCLVFPGAHFLA